MKQTGRTRGGKQVRKNNRNAGSELQAVAEGWLQLAAATAAHLKATGSDHMLSFFSKSLRIFEVRLR
jgi:hypothetical protein